MTEDEDPLGGAWHVGLWVVVVTVGVLVFGTAFGSAAHVVVKVAATRKRR